MNRQNVDGKKIYVIRIFRDKGIDKIKTSKQKKKTMD